MDKLKVILKTVYFISMPITFLGFFIPILIIKLNFNPVEIGVLYSVVSFVGLAIRPLVGWWIDKKGKRSAFLIGTVIYILAVATFIFVNSFIELIVARALLVLGGSFFWVSINAMIAEVSDDGDRAKNYGIKNEIASKGGTIGMFIASFILYQLKFKDSYRLIFFVFLILSLYSLIKAFSYSEVAMVKQNKEEVITLEKDNQLLKYTVIMGVLSLLSAVLSPLFLVYFKDNFWGSMMGNNTSMYSAMSTYGLVLAPGIIMSMFLPSKLGKISDRIGRKPMVIIGMVLGGLATMLLPLVTSFWGFFVFFTISYLAEEISSAGQSALFYDLTKGVNYARSNGFYMLATGIGGVVGPLVGTTIYQYFDKRMIFYIDGIALITAAAAIFFVIRENRVRAVEVEEY